MEEAIKIIKELKNTLGKNKKKDILEQNKDNQMLKDILYFVYNPYIVTGLSSKKIKKDVSNVKKRGMRQFKHPIEESVLLSDGDFHAALVPNKSYDITCMFDYLIDHHTGRDEDIAWAQAYIKLQPEEYREIYEQIFTKDLKLGIKAKIINQVWENFIPEFNVMLAEKYDNRKSELLKNKPEIIITQKLDRNKSCCNCKR